MFIFANFMTEIDFERTQFQQMAVSLAELYLFEFSTFRVLRESYFKAPKIPWGEYFYYRNVHFCSFCTKN